MSLMGWTTWALACILLFDRLSQNLQYPRRFQAAPQRSLILGEDGSVQVKVQLGDMLRGHVQGCSV